MAGALMAILLCIEHRGGRNSKLGNFCSIVGRISMLDVMTRYAQLHSTQLSMALITMKRMRKRRRCMLPRKRETLTSWNHCPKGEQMSTSEMKVTELH